MVLEHGRDGRAAGLPSNVIWSVDPEAGVGLVDVLPRRANKRHAIAFLAKRGGFGSSDVLFAGDSGNDLDVLLSPYPAVLVANADADVRRRPGRPRRARTSTLPAAVASG